VAVTEPAEEAPLVPEDGVTLSQLPPERVDTLTAKFSEPAPELRTAIDCGEVTLPPVTAWNRKPVCES